MKKLFCTLTVIFAICASTIFIASHQENLLTKYRNKSDEFIGNQHYAYYGPDTMYGMMQSAYASTIDETGNIDISSLYTINTTDPYIIEKANRVMIDYLNAWENDLDTFGIYYTALNHHNDTLVKTSRVDLLNSNQSTILDTYYAPVIIDIDAKGEMVFNNLTKKTTAYEESLKNYDAKKTVETYMLQDIIYNVMNQTDIYDDGMGNQYYRQSKDIASSENTQASELLLENESTNTIYFEYKPTSEETIETAEVIYLSDLTFELKSLQNVSIGFGFGMGKNGETLSYEYTDSIKDIALLIYPYLAFFGFLMFILGLLLPIKWAKKATVLKHIKEIKLEIWGAIVAGLIALLIAYPMIYAYDYLGVISSGLNILFEANVSKVMANILVYGILSLLMFAGYVLGFMIRYMFHIGFGYYLVHYSLILSFIAWLIKKVKYFLEDLNGFYSDNIFSKANIIFIIFLSVNSILLIILFPPSFVLIYGLALLLIYMFVNKAANRDYQALKQITGKIAEGELNVEIKENLGLYNDVKEDLTNIKQSFSKAVFEEVKSQRMKTELISNVSHDLKTPLTNIINYTDLLKTPDLDVTIRNEYIETVDRNSKRLKNLIDDLFEMSKLNSGEIALEIHELDMCNLIQQVCLEWEDKLSERGLGVKYQFDQSKVMINLDGYKAHRIIENLLSNIYKYAMENTRIYISVFVIDNEVRVEFKNISAEEIDVKTLDITDRFVRGDASRNTEGSGLGLAIAKSLTELHGGTLEVVVDGDLFKIILKFPHTSNNQ